jgi:hypothetical protein
MPKLPNIRPCKCPACQILASLAIACGNAGDLQLAEEIARSITWFPVDEDSEGYTETWGDPQVDDPTVN